MKEPSLNFFERAIYAISPQTAAKRHMARMALNATAGGYSGAGYRDSMAYYQPGVGDADADSVSDLRELRARSRDLLRNSPIAIGAIETQVTHIVGTGLSMQSRIDATTLGLTEAEASERQKQIEKEFALWAESEFADAYGQQNFYELQDLALRTAMASGDAIVVLAGVRRQDWPFRLALQVIEADRVSNPDGKADSDTLVQGIEKDASGAPVRVHIANKHPGRYTATKDIKWTAINIRGASGRRNVIHLYRKLRPGQTRGVPELAPVIETIKQLTRYSSAEVDAAVNSAAFAVFTKMDPEAFTDLFDESGRTQLLNAAKNWDGTLKPGMVTNLLPGESIETAAMNRPNPNFDPFVQAFMGQIGMAMNIPKEVLTKHFQSSYSAARAALLDAWRTFRVRREWLASKLCQPVYEEWLADAVAAGRIEAPGFFTDAATRKAWCGAAWSGDGPGSIDPLKEAQAARERIDVGLTTLPEEIIAYDGGDWETKHREQALVAAARKEAGMGQPAPAAAPQVSQPTEPDSDDSEGDGIDDGEDDAEDSGMESESAGLRRPQNGSSTTIS